MPCTSRLIFRMVEATMDRLLLGGITSYIKS
jgi:hypothetical protein